MNIGQPERATQNRVIALFRDELHYRYLGDRSDRDNNSNIEDELLTAHLTRSGYNPAQISKAIYDFRTEANHHTRGLYGNNKEVYKKLRYGVPVKIEAGKVTETVKLINWEEPGKNDFAIAEEVTLNGNHERRPDIVFYVNGIAVGVLELKNSRISIGDGIRQNISNQQAEFNAPFFSTVQFIFAGNDSEGLQYGTVGTPEKYFLRWKEDEQDDTRFKLDKYLLKICAKDRLIELIHDFVLFDGGMKKLPRVHQYFGIKAAQKHVRERRGGIIWHTQGSGKSIVMVLLAKWILENRPHARVVIVTDRDELDKQIEGVFSESGEPIKRTGSGRDLMKQLGQARPRLLCSLVHKFGRKGIDNLDNFEQFIAELQAQPSQTVGEIFVFVDECHRTQSGKLHRVMKAIMPNATFIGFTGTPLLKKDKQTSLEVFGGYIHTYKFSEAVQDEVVLDLIYEARDIDQRLGSNEKIDAWFDAKTRGLNDWQRAALRERWGTMQSVLSSKSRMDRVVSDIVFDFSVKPRLNEDRGNALLVASSIYEACKYFTLFAKTPFRGKCAVITSYNPMTRDITTEDTGANSESDKEFIYHTYTELLKDTDAAPGMTKTETYEDRAKDLFKKEPANMKLSSWWISSSPASMRRPAPISTSISPCRITGSFRPFAAPTASTPKTRNSATSSITKTSSRKSKTPLLCTPPNWIAATAAASIPKSSSKIALRKAASVLIAPSRPSPCCASRSNRPPANWNTFIISAATPKFRMTSRNGNRSAPHSTKPWPVSSAPSPI